MKVNELFDLSGKVSIVTGGARGLGRQMVKALAEAGSDIVICSRKIEQCEETAREVERSGVKAVAYRCNIGEESDVVGLVEFAVRKFKKIDILVNNAGTTWGERPEAISIERWKRVIDVNLNGTFICTQKVGRVMIERKAGKIINITSYNGLKGGDPLYMDALPYSASKGALVALTRDLAVKWAKYNIQINGIAPGWFDTDMTKWSLENYKSQIIARIPQNKCGGENDLKGAIVFLASMASDYVTGHILCVDGGLMSF